MKDFENAGEHFLKCGLGFGGMTPAMIFVLNSAMNYCTLDAPSEELHCWPHGLSVI